MTKKNQFFKSISGKEGACGGTLVPRIGEAMKYSVCSGKNKINKKGSILKEFP
jgi:hypothetical protein